MLKARLKKGKAPEKPKKITSGQYLTVELPKVLRKYAGKRYTLESASKLVTDIQQVIVSASCIQPTWESRVRELQGQLKGKAFVLKNGITDGVFFVENVGIYENTDTDTLRLVGLFARFDSDGKLFSDVSPAKLAYPLCSTCVRDGKFRTHLDGHNYSAYVILSDEEYRNALQSAKIALARVSKRLNEL